MKQRKRIRTKLLMFRYSRSFNGICEEHAWRLRKTIETLAKLTGYFPDNSK